VLFLMIPKYGTQEALQSAGEGGRGPSSPGQNVCQRNRRQWHGLVEGCRVRPIATGGASVTNAPMTLSHLVPAEAF
jgi:hypothetical protein